MIPYYSPNLTLFDILKLNSIQNANKKTIDFFKSYTQKEYVLLTSSCRASIYLAYKAMGENFTVVTSPLTCTSALEPIIYSNNKIHFVDCTLENFNIDVNKIKNIPSNSKVIQISYMGGLPIDLEEIRRIAKERDILILEDCAQALGAIYKNQNVGVKGDISCFSMIKNAYGIGGGVLATNDEEIYLKAKKIQDTFGEFNKKLLYFRVVRNIIETHRNIKFFNFIYNKLMSLKNIASGEQTEDIFLKNAKKPPNLFVKIFVHQSKKFNKLHEKRNEKALQIISFLKEHKFIDYPLGNIETASFTKLFVFSKDIHSPNFVESLNKIGIEAKHLEHKYKSYYQERFDRLVPYNEIESLKSCDTYFDIHDHIFSIPLYESMSDSMLLRLVNKLISQSKKKGRRVIFDIGHPAQVHQFKNVYYELKKLNYECLFTAKDKEISHYLLNKYNLPYSEMGKPKKGLINKILYIPKSCFRFYRVAKKFNPDIILSRFSFHASWISFLLRKKHIGFTDTEHVGLADTLTVPFVKTKLTANSYKKDLGRNHLRYSGNIELFYLHKNRFIPDNTILKFLGVNKNEKYVIVRFVSWDAHHDIGLNGITLENKVKLVQNLSKYAKVFITSEKKLPEELESYQISIPPEKMHDAIYFSSLLVGESATMASEAAVLGIPSIYIDEVGRGYTDEEGDYGLVFNYKPLEQSKAIEKAIELIKSDNVDVFKKVKEEFLKEKIDVTAFVVWFVENYPGSVKIMKENSDYQLRFK